MIFCFEITVFIFIFYETLFVNDQVCVFIKHSSRMLDIYFEQFIYHKFMKNSRDEKKKSLRLPSPH